MLVLQPVLATPKSCGALTTPRAGNAEERVHASEAADVPGAFMHLCLWAGLGHIRQGTWVPVCSSGAGGHRPRCSLAGPLSRLGTPRAGSRLFVSAQSSAWDFPGAGLTSRALWGCQYELFPFLLS